MVNNKIFWGIVTAAAAGAVIGLLFAPDQGFKTRKKIKSKSNDWAHDMLGSLETGKNRVMEVAGRAKKSAREVADEIADKAEKAADKL